MKPREFPCALCPGDSINVEPPSDVKGCVYIEIVGAYPAVQLTATNAVKLAEALLKSARKALQDG